MDSGTAISRRAFLRLSFTRPAVETAAGHASPTNSPTRTMPVHRPPGAVREEDFLARCTKCDDCAAACPHGSIVKAPLRFRGIAGTPMIDVAHAPCHMCEDMPCITACTTGALVVEAGTRMGEARINKMTCLAFQGSFCTVCSERCPVPGAITLEAGRPVIHADACTGCGVCAHVCPAPSNAIILLPARDRPAAHSAETPHE